MPVAACGGRGVTFQFTALWTMARTDWLSVPVMSVSSRDIAPGSVVRPGRIVWFTNVSVVASARSGPRTTAGITAMPSTIPRVKWASIRQSRRTSGYRISSAGITLMHVAAASHQPALARRPRIDAAMHPVNSARTRRFA